MTITIDGTNGITSPALTSQGAITGDGISFADNAPSNSLVVNPSGNVGIGTSTIGDKLTVGGAAAFIRVDRSDGEPGVTLRYNGSNTNRGDIAVTSGGALYFTAGGSTERMRIDSSGNLRVGATSGYGRLSVLQDSDGNATVSECTSASLTNTVHLIYASRNTTNGTFAALGYYNTGAGAYKFKVLDSGNVQNANNSYGAISDAKIKEKIVDATPKLEKLNQVRVVNYNLIGDTQKQIGVIAQELEQVFPGMVEETSDKDAEGNDLGTTTKSVKYSVFVPMLIKAIQELKAQLDESNLILTNVRTELDATKAEVAVLKGAA